MTPERAKSATPAQPRSLPKPFAEEPHHQPTTKCLKNKPEKAPRPSQKHRSHSPISSLQTTVKGIHSTQFCRIKGCGGEGCPPPPPHTHTPMIFQRLKLPQQIIYRRKGNLLESPDHLKYLENILILRFYEQFSRSSRNLGHFWKFEKVSISSIIIDVFLKKPLLPVTCVLS